MDSTTSATASATDSVLHALKASGQQTYETARPMPAAYYRSEKVLQAELDQVFRRQWICLAHQEEIPAVGDFLVCDLVGESIIYVNLDHDAESLASQLGGLSSMVQNYHMDEMKRCYSAEQTWPVNWKCLAENFMEGYHLSHVHQETLHPITPTHLCEHFPPGPAYLGYYPRYPSTVDTRGTGHADLTEKEKQVSLMFSVMPAHVAGVAAHAVFYVLLQPQGVDAVRAKLGAAVFDDSISDQEKNDIGAFFERIMDEDKVQLERLYHGLSSRFFEPQVLASADHEGTVLDFYHYMDRVMNGS